MDAREDLGRRVSRLLSGYLCGTHSGLLARSTSGRSLAARRPEIVSILHSSLDPPQASEQVELGRTLWKPEEQDRLAAALRTALETPDVVDLIFFGSQARGGRTGFSDVDAILVISDEAADDPERLRALRPRVLAAQRAVVAYQPLQHHGFEVATHKLLRQAESALGLPAVALTETRALHGILLTATVTGSPTRRGQLERSVARLHLVRSWPKHRWYTYLNLAMFELLPALYLQARGASIPKSASFAEARSDFGSAWWPYDVLAEVRARWPRIRQRRLELAASVVRNPWMAVAGWRRMPAAIPDPVGALLTPELLEGLRSLACAMVERTRSAR
jgi:hypothetical protein